MMHQGWTFHVKQCAVMALLLVTGCATQATTAPIPASTLAPGDRHSPTALPAGDPQSPMPGPGTCHMGSQDNQPLPDPVCTPGATNPDVTPATIQSTICKTGWTATIRPPSAVTGRMKRQSEASYNTSGPAEYDHLVSLQLGGHPLDPRNLWPEPGPVPNGKDTVENRLNDAVCAGLVPLDAAQTAIARNWVGALTAVGLTATGRVCLSAQPDRCSPGRHTDQD